MLKNLKTSIEEAVAIQQTARALRSQKNSMWVAEATILRDKICKIVNAFPIESNSDLAIAEKIEVLARGSGHETLDSNLRDVLEEAYRCMNRETA